VLIAGLNKRPVDATHLCFCVLCIDHTHGPELGGSECRGNDDVSQKVAMSRKKSLRSEADSGRRFVSVLSDDKLIIFHQQLETVTLHAKEISTCR